MKHSSHNSSNITTEDDNNHNLWITSAIGVLLALGSGLAQAAFIIAEKKALSCEPPVTGPVLSFWISAAGLPISIALVPIFEKLTFVSDLGRYSFSVIQSQIYGNVPCRRESKSFECQLGV